VSVTTDSPMPTPARTSPGSADRTGRLVVTGRDRPGIVAAVSSILQDFGANIVSLDQYSTDAEGGSFFQRTVFDLADLPARRSALEAEFAERLGKEGLICTLTLAQELKRVAIFASTSDHCLVELLWRHRRGELKVDIPMVISNHSEHAEVVRQFGIPFFFVPVTGDKTEAEREHLRLLQGNVDLVVLARYMQIISDDFLQKLDVPVINIHHSFLPAFVGAGPLLPPERVWSLWGWGPLELPESTAGVILSETPEAATGLGEPPSKQPFVPMTVAVNLRASRVS
jgi:formyltetrahydrofolate deformylase